MDYGKLVRRAWDITKKNPWLWVLGFFAASTGGGSFSMPSSGGSGNPGEFGMPPAGADQMIGDIGSWIQSNIGLILIVVFVLLGLMILFWVLGIASKAGLFSEVGRADAGETTSLGRGWKTGFSKFWRTFMIQLITSIPVLIVMFVMIAVVVMGIVGLAAAGRGTGEPLISDGAAMAAVLSGIAGLFFFIFLIGILSIIVSAWTTLSVAAGVIEDRTFGMALRRGWQIIRNRFGSTLMVLLIDTLISFAVGVAMGILMVIVMIPAAIVVFRAGNLDLGAVGWVIITAVVVVTFIIGAIVSSAMSTFSTSLWVAYFRTVTGLDRVVPAVEAGAPTPPVAPQAG